MSEAIVWSKDGCTFCVQAKKLLEQRNIKVEERNITGESWTKEQLLESVPNARTLPQIFLDGQYVGGYVELRKRLENEI